MMKRQYLFAFAALLFSGSVYAQQATKIEAESFVEGNGPTKKELKNGATIVGKFANGKWIKLAGVDMGEGATGIKIKVASGASEEKPGVLEIKLKDRKGKAIGSLPINSKGWTKFEEQTIPISKTSGVHDIFIISKAGGIVLDWIEIVK